MTKTLTVQMNISSLLQKTNWERFKDKFKEYLEENDNWKFLSMTDTDPKNENEKIVRFEYTVEWTINPAELNPFENQKETVEKMLSWFKFENYSLNIEVIAISDDYLKASL